MIDGPIATNDFRDERDEISVTKFVEKDDVLQLNAPALFSVNEVPLD